MEKKILVPLDGTKTGEAILPRIENLVLKSSPKMEADITLLKVISNMNFNNLTDDDRAQLPISESERQELVAEAQAYLDTVAKRLNSKGIKTNRLVTFGHAAEEIVKTANETKTQLIAMATRGRSGIGRWAMGSVTEKVIKMEGQIPVLAVLASGKEEQNPVITMGSLQSLVKHSPVLSD
ncbi:MAG: UspA domain protein [Chloroflexi bacterium]|nr:UspA domain protein [Chloroflexota bacterium]